MCLYIAHVVFLKLLGAKSAVKCYYSNLKKKEIVNHKIFLIFTKILNRCVSKTKNFNTYWWWWFTTLMVMISISMVMIYNIDGDDFNIDGDDLQHWWWWFQNWWSWFTTLMVMISILMVMIYNLQMLANDSRVNSLSHS